MKIGQSLVRNPTPPAPAAPPAHRLTWTEVVINKARRCKQRIINSLYSGQAAQVLHGMLLFMHILWFYTLLLATMLETESINSWATQLSTWILITNSVFYVTLIYLQYNNSLKKEYKKKVVSNFYTLVYTLNVGLAYYFWIKIYPDVEKPVKDRIIYIYTYPAISVLANIIAQQQLLKKLRFRDVGESVLFLSLYVTANMLQLDSHDAEKPSHTVWIDTVEMRENFFDLVMLTVMGYLQLKLTFKLISLFKMSRPARTTENTNANAISQV